jgi:hypothetical protein
MFFLFPGIQVRSVLKRGRAFWQIVKIGDPFEAFGAESRHFFLAPEKYFFQRTCLLQVSFLLPNSRGV